MSNRSFLFLQGVASPFFDKLASTLRANGVKTFRVKFCGGDVAFHRRGQAQRFLDNVEQLDVFYSDLFTELKVTDLVLFGDTRPVHKPAIKLAKQLGVDIHVYEEGYLRPDWVTLDSGGVNAHSSLSKQTPTYFRQRATSVPRDVSSYKTGYSQWVRLFHDVRYNIARMLDSKRFPGYKRHRIIHPVREYIGWIRRYPALIPMSWLARYNTKKLISTKSHYYVYPLQLCGDSQIQVHSRFDGVNHATSEILHSFASHASKNTYLVIKNHPLDTGVSKSRKFITNLSRELGIQDRTIFMDGGHLPTLLSHSKGTVVVNSTTGMSALHHKSPIITLGKALYDLPGLTYQGRLDDFWRRAKKSDYDLFKDFRDVIIHDTQINGNFYTKKGIEMTVAASMKRFDITVVSVENEQYINSGEQTSMVVSVDVTS